MTRVNLTFPTKYRGLAGYDLGKLTYKEQIEPLYNGTQGKVTLVFPDSVEVVASSFVHGLLTGLINQIGYEGVQDSVTIESIHPDLEDRIWNRLY